MASLLSSLSRAQRLKPPPHLTCLLAPPALSSPTHIQTRNASAHTKQQKKTIAKYSARQAIKGGKGTDFLAQAKVQTRGDKGKKGGPKKGAVEEEPTGEVKDRLAEASGPVREEIYTGGIPPLEDVELENPDFRRTTPRYEEYERLLPEKEQEEVTSTILTTERDGMIKRLWEPFETEDFNLKSLLGNNPPPEKVEGPDVVLQDARPSKMLYYTEEELQRFLPEGVAGRITKEFETFKKKGVMVRPVVEDVVGWLAEWRRKQFIGRKMDEDYYTILGGPIGCGKSVSLNPIVQWARLTGWLVVFIPDGKDWANHGYLSYSKVNETWFGQPQLATKWITALLNAHGDKLATIPLRTDFVVQDVDPDKPTFTSAPQETLRSLLEYGLKHPDQASDCVWYFRQELCTVHEYPVLIVVDGVNVIRDHSQYGDPIDPYVFAPSLDTSRLVMSRAFQDFRHHGLTNGCYVGTFCSSASMRAMKKRRPNVDLLRTRYDLDPRLNVLEVPPISRAEAHVLSEWYRENEVYVSEMPAQTVDYMWAMSQGNGDIFWKQTGPQ